MKKLLNILNIRFLKYKKIDEFTYNIKTLKCADCNSYDTKIDEAQPPFIGAENYVVVSLKCNKCNFSYSLTIEGK